MTARTSMLVLAFLPFVLAAGCGGILALCVLTVWFALLVVLFGKPQGMLSQMLYCFAGVFSACVVAGYSHDWVLEQQTEDVPVDRDALHDNSS